MKTQFCRWVLAVTAASIGYVAMPQVALGIQNTTIVAATNDPAPGIAFGTFNRFSGANINNLDAAAFRSSVLSLGFPSVGIWTNGLGPLRLVARTGQFAPGAGFSIFSNLGDPVYNSADHVGFLGALQLGGAVTPSNFLGVWSDASGFLSLVARTGSVAPGTKTALNPAGAKFISFSRIVLPDLGRLTILASARVGSLVKQGVWIGNTQGQLKLLFRAGGTLKLSGVTRTISSFTTLSTPNGEGRGYNNRGTLVAVVTFTDGVQALVTVTQSGVARAFAFRNGTTPGIKGSKYLSFGIPVINDLGRPAYLARFSGPGTTLRQGIWSAVGQNPSLVTRTGLVAPGGLETFASLGNPVSNNAGQVAFNATLTGGITGVWANTNGFLSLVARSQSQAPDVPFGAVFSQFRRVALPDQGGAVILADLVIGPGGVTPANSQGIWAVDTFGTLRKIVRTGDTLTIGATLKTIAALSIFSSTLEASAQTASYNSIGDLIYVATFTDGTQAVVETVFL